MTGIEEKYSTIRNRLDAFGYKAPLGVDTIPLVERLFADLVHTTGIGLNSIDALLSQWVGSEVGLCS